MSVSNSFIALEWPRIETAPKDDDLAGYLFDSIDAGEDWLGPVPFGDQIDSEYFENWDRLIEFNDWFREVQSVLDPKLMEQFSSLFMAVGLLHDEETSAPDPRREGFDFSGEWLLGSMPPETVAQLAAEADALDLDLVQREFQKGVDETPCEAIPDGNTVANWISALGAGLRSTAESGRGILLGAA